MEVKRYQKSLFRLISDKDIKEDMDIDGYKGARRNMSGNILKNSTRKALRGRRTISIIAFQWRLVQKYELCLSSTL